MSYLSFDKWCVGWVLTLVGLASVANAEPATGIEELSHLLEKHPAQKIGEDEIASLPVYEKQLTLFEGRPPVIFQIPGFKKFGCGACHQADELIQNVADQMKRAIHELETQLPEAKPIPLREYIIQPYTDKLLQAGQLAHATFDTIRLFPGTVIIDSKIYEGQTHLHEVLHLNQPFLGAINELEAYGLNVLADPRFLLLNYPYFNSVVSAYFEPKLGAILKEWYGRDINETYSVPREVQWFLLPSDSDSMEKIRVATQKLTPLLKEASRLYRKHPYKMAYLTEQTGVRSLALDIAAVKLLDRPSVKISPDKMQKGLATFKDQMTRDDNTRLGYVIDRKEEASMTLKYTTGPKDEVSRHALYFHYLKTRFISEEGEVFLPIDNAEDFENFLKRKVGDLKKMADYKGLTEVERRGALRMIEQVKKIPATSK